MPLRAGTLPGIVASHRKPKSPSCASPRKVKKGVNITSKVKEGVVATVGYLSSKIRNLDAW